jgi:hypothetical protein
MIPWWSPALADPAAPPTVAPCSVMRARYTVDGKPSSPGLLLTALRVGDKVALVTPHAVFGPNAGMAAQLGPDEVVARVTGLTAFDLDGATECGRSVKAAKVEGAAPSTPADASHDVAVFRPQVDSGLQASRVMAKTFAPFPLSTALPKVGDAVWVAFPTGGAAVQAAKVGDLGATAMYVEYTSRDLDLAGSVGAPILDASGGARPAGGRGRAPHGAQGSRHRGPRRPVIHFEG